MGSFSKEEWGKLTKEQRSQVHKACQTWEAANDKKPKAKGTAPNKRSIQALTKIVTEQRKLIAEMKKASTAGGLSTSMDDAPTSNAGTTFGGHATTKKTKIAD
jgi:indole-3-glycerol phosphate synthase